MDFNKALNALPDGTGYDSFTHKTVQDLCYLCLHELDLVAEREFWHPVSQRKKYLKFCVKHGFYANEAQAMYQASLSVSKNDCETI
jgi:hypothetical protein